MILVTAGGSGRLGVAVQEIAVVAAADKAVAVVAGTVVGPALAVPGTGVEQVAEAEERIVVAVVVAEHTGPVLGVEVAVERIAEAELAVQVAVVVEVASVVEDFELLELG